MLMLFVLMLLCYWWLCCVVVVRTQLLFSLPQDRLLHPPIIDKTLPVLPNAFPPPTPDQILVLGRNCDAFSMLTLSLWQRMFSSETVEMSRLGIARSRGLWSTLKFCQQRLGSTRRQMSVWFFFFLYDLVRGGFCKSGDARVLRRGSNTETSPVYRYILHQRWYTLPSFEISPPARRCRQP